MRRASMATCGITSTTKTMVVIVARYIPYGNEPPRPPTMLLFDAPNREVCTVKRSRTNTPLQALSLLNEVTFIEAARALATEMLRLPNASPRERIEFAYQRVLGRLPNDNERKVMTSGLAEDLQRFTQQPQQAEQLVRVGDLPVPTDLQIPELAAYTLVANVLLNLDEFVTRE